MITCTRRLQWCMGHRLLGHEGECSHLHGHNYIGFFHARRKEEIGISLTGESLDEIGRVVDFSILREKVGGWIEEHWDHGFVYSVEDTWTHDTLALAADIYPNGQKRFPLAANPTAEELASFLLDRVCPMVLRGTGVEVFKVTLWETENCYAEVEIS